MGRGDRRDILKIQIGENISLSILRNLWAPTPLFGLRLRTSYRDIEWRDGGLRLFIALNREGDEAITVRSWYVLTLNGWKLLRREDRWGEWVRGKRRPPLLDAPSSIPDRAWELRKFFRPYQLIDWYGRKKEVISFPSPEARSVTLMLREPGDPTTLEEVRLEEYVSFREGEA
jgi:hypothetical protein